MFQIYIFENGNLNFLHSKRSVFYTVAVSLLFFVFALIVFSKIDHRPLLDYDEAIYAQIAQEAYEGSSSQFGFTWLGNEGLHRAEHWFEKPPLMFWLIQTGYAVFGIGEVGARVWVALFSLGILLLVYFGVRKIFGSSLAALLSVATLFISYQFIENATILQLDIPVTFFILTACLAYYLALSENKKYFYVFGLAVGLAGVTKSVIGFLPLPIALVYSLTTGNFRFLKEKEIYLSALIALGIIVPWHIVESWRYGMDFWQQYLFYHVLGRFATPLESNSGSFWYYADILREHRLLSAVLLPSLVYFLYQSIWKKSYRFISIAALFIFIFFSVSGTKLPAYILTIYPFLAIIAGVALGDLIRSVKLPIIFKPMIALAVITVFVFLGARFVNYEKQVSHNQYLQDSKLIGLYLKENHTELPLFYYSNVGTKPSIIFYSNRIVYHLPVPSPRPDDKFVLITETDHNFKNSQLIIDTPTHDVYLVQ